METNKFPPTPDRAELRAARKQSKRLRAFYRLCLVVALVVPLTAIVSAMTSPNRHWFVLIAPGLAIAIVFAAVDTVGRRLLLGRDWQERKVRQLLARQVR